MNLKRLILRYSLNFQKLKIKLYNLESGDFQKAYIIISKRLYRIIHLRNLVVFCLAFVIFVFSMFLSSFTRLDAYYMKDKPLNGGIYAEGSMGKFLRLNPLYSKTNQNDEDAVNLIFNGLTKYDQGKDIKPDLASKWTVQDNGRTYLFELKKGVKWQDGAEFSADDVIFTINLIQNSDARSTLYEAWKGVKVEKTNKGEIKFSLKEADDSFIENTTTKILPKHILEKVPAANIQTVDFNTNPVGTGPYKFESLAKESGRETLILSKNNNYFDKKPYLDKVVMEGFLDEKEMLDEYNKKNIQAISNPSEAVENKLADQKGSVDHQYTLPRYVAAFFNVENEFLKEKNLRVAIGLSLNRQEILNAAASGKGLIDYSPLAYGPDGQTEQYKQDVPRAIDTLKAANYTLEGGQLKLQGKDISLKIVTGNNDQLTKTAEAFQKNLKSIGIKSEIKTADMNSLQNEYIRPRNYDILIVGENAGLYPDLFSFWHSSQVQDPGLNFSKYKDRELDKYLEIMRKENAQEKQAKLVEIKKIFAEEVPAVYLYNPFYDFIVSNKIKGIADGKLINPADRLETIENWYIKYNQVTIDD